MRKQFIAIAALVMTPSLALAQAGSGGYGSGVARPAASAFGAIGPDTTDTTFTDTTNTRTMDTTRSDTSMIRPDTTTDTTMIRPDTTTDTTMYRPDTTSDTTTVESQGDIYTPPSGATSASNMGLSDSQVKELQQAISDAGCDTGPVDGIIGPLTRQGIACVRDQKAIESNHLNDVLSALGLGFTASPSATVSEPSSGAVNRSDTTTAYPTDTTTLPDTTTYPDTTTVPDTTSYPDTTTLPDTTTQPADTTMSQPDTTAYPTDTTSTPVDTTMNPMNPMHPTDSTAAPTDTSTTRTDTTSY